MTPRLPDWQARLGALLAARLAAPFAWATNDCCSFAADAVCAYTGVDPWAAMRGKYSDAAGAAHALFQYGGIAGLGDAFFGIPIPPLMAFVGDVGMIELGGRNLLAVCNGATWLAPGERALVAVPQALATLAWRF